MTSNASDLEVSAAILRSNSRMWRAAAQQSHKVFELETTTPTFSTSCGRAEEGSEASMPRIQRGPASSWTHEAVRLCKSSLETTTLGAMCIPRERDWLWTMSNVIICDTLVRGCISDVRVVDGASVVPSKRWMFSAAGALRVNCVVVAALIVDSMELSHDQQGLRI